MSPPIHHIRHRTRPGSLTDPGRSRSTLAHEGFGSLQNAQQATAAINTARATLAKDEAALDAAQKQIATREAQLEEANAALATIITKREQFHSNIIGQAVTGFSPQDRSLLDQRQHVFAMHGVPDPARSYHQAEILPSTFVAQQALILAVADSFYVMAVVWLTAAFAVALTRSPSALARA